MGNPKWHWLQRERAIFFAKLSETGSPDEAAKAVERSVSEAYRQRDGVPGFAAAWQRALGIAWDQVETRVLAGLLAGAANAVTPAPVIDTKVVLAVMQRRQTAKAGRVPAAADPGRVATLRAEIRALATGGGSGPH